MEYLASVYQPHPQLLPSQPGLIAHPDPISFIGIWVIEVIFKPLHKNLGDFRGVIAPSNASVSFTFIYTVSVRTHQAVQVGLLVLADLDSSISESSSLLSPFSWLGFLSSDSLDLSKGELWVRVYLSKSAPPRCCSHWCSVYSNHPCCIIWYGVLLPGLHRVLL